MIKVIFFDVDGVLVDAEYMHYEALNLALVAHGFSKIGRQDHLTNFNGYPTKAKLNFLVQAGEMTVKEAEEVAQTKQEVTMRVIEDLPVDQSKIDLLVKLKELGFTIGAVSNAKRDSIIKMFQVTGLDPYIDFIRSNEDVERPKPWPDPYLSALDYVGVSGDDVYVVEDTELGKQSAMQACIGEIIKVEGVNQVNIEYLKNHIKELNY